VRRIIVEVSACKVCAEICVVKFTLVYQPLGTIALMSAAADTSRLDGALDMRPYMLLSESLS
jgi:hypothetical protein